MIIVLKPDATAEQIKYIEERIKKVGLTPMVSKGTQRTIIGVIGPEDILRVTPLEVFPGVEKVLPVLAPYKLVSKEFQPQASVIDLGRGVKIGTKKIVTIAGIHGKIDRIDDTTIQLEVNPGSYLRIEKSAISMERTSKKA